MAPLRIFVSHDTNASPRDRDIATQLILDLQAAGMEIVTGEEYVSNKHFVQFIQQALPQCQHFIFIQNPQAMQSPRVEAAVKLALELIDRNGLKNALRVITTTTESSLEPIFREKMHSVDASRDYLRARQRIMIELGLLKLNGSPEDTLSNLVVPTAGGSAGIANPPPILTPVENKPMLSVSPVPEVRTATSAAPAETGIAIPPPQTAQPENKYSSPPPNRAYIDRPPPLPGLPRYGWVWLVILSTLQVLTLAFAIGGFFWLYQRPPVTNITTVPTATPIQDPLTTQERRTLDQQVQQAIESQQDSYIGEGKPEDLRMNDPLNGQTNNQYSWPTVDNQESTGCFFHENAYVLRAQGPETCLANEIEVKELVYQIQIQIINGEAGGIVFRSVSASENYYKFEIDIRGNYALYQSTNGQEYIIDTGYSPYIKPGLNQTNLIGVVAQGGVLEFYVNRQWVEYTEGEDHLASGSVGVTGGRPYDTTPTEIKFTHAKVWDLEEE